MPPRRRAGRPAYNTRGADRAGHARSDAGSGIHMANEAGVGAPGNQKTIIAQLVAQQIAAAIPNIIAQLNQAGAGAGGDGAGGGGAGGSEAGAGAGGGGAGAGAGGAGAGVVNHDVMQIMSGNRIHN